MKNKKEFLNDIKFINDSLAMVDNFSIIEYSQIIEQKLQQKWGSNRSFMLLKLNIEQNREIFLLEISRRNANAGHRGLLFELSDLTKDFLQDLIIQISNKKGVVKEIYSLNGVYLYDYDHTLGNGNMSDKILRELKKYLADEKKKK